MTVRDEYVLSLHRRRINIFRLARRGTQLCTEDIVSLPLKEEAFDGYFLNPTSVEFSICHADTFASVLYGAIQSELRHAVVLRHESPEGTSQFTLLEGLDASPPDVYGRSCLALSSLGISGRRIFCMTIPTAKSWHHQEVYTGLVHRKVHSYDESFTFINEYRHISRDGFPLHHLTSTVEFDDGNGLLLVGTISGDIRLASFFEDEFEIGRAHV